MELHPDGARSVVLVVEVHLDRHRRAARGEVAHVFRIARVREHVLAAREIDMEAAVPHERDLAELDQEEPTVGCERRVEVLERREIVEALRAEGLRIAREDGAEPRPKELAHRGKAAHAEAPRRGDEPRERTARGHVGHLRERVRIGIDGVARSRARSMIDFDLEVAIFAADLREAPRGAARASAAAPAREPIALRRCVLLSVPCRNPSDERLRLHGPRAPGSTFYGALSASRRERSWAPSARRRCAPFAACRPPGRAKKLRKKRSSPSRRRLRRAAIEKRARLQISSGSYQKKARLYRFLRASIRSDASPADAPCFYRTHPPLQLAAGAFLRIAPIFYR